MLNLTSPIAPSLPAFDGRDLFRHRLLRDLPGVILVHDISEPGKKKTNKQRLNGELEGAELRRRREATGTRCDQQQRAPRLEYFRSIARAWNCCGDRSGCCG